MADEMKKRTNRDYTAWDLNVPHLRGADNADHIAEEVADVRIMLDQVCIMFGIEFRAMRHRTEKLERLQRRLETE